MKLTTLLIILGTGFTAHGQSTRQKVPPGYDKVKLYSYSILRPLSWDIHFDYGKFDLSMIAPRDSDSDKYAENIGVLIRDVPDSLSFDEIVDVNLETMRADPYFEGAIFETNRNNNSGMEFLDVSWSMIIKDSVEIQVVEHMYLFNSKLYVLCFGAETKKIEGCREVAELVMASIRFRIQ